MNGVKVELINDEALEVKNSIYDKWLNDENTTYQNEKIYDMHYSFLTEEGV